MMLSLFAKAEGTVSIRGVNIRHKFQDTMRLLMTWQEKFVKILTYRLQGSAMKYRAIIKKSEEWWIGWLIDLPGVNAQERTREELLESLRIGAEDMLAMDVPFVPDAQLTTIDVPNPTCILERA